MRAVNLLPKQEQQHRRRRRRARAGTRPTPWPVVLGLAGTAIASAAIAAAFLQASGTAADRQEELAAASAQLAAMPAPKPVQNSDSTLAAERAKRAAAVASAFSYHVSWDRVLRRLALVLPEDVWLTSLAGQAPNGPGETASVAAGAAPSGFSMMGYTYSHAAVARLLSRLSVLPDLTNVQLQTSALGQLGTRKIVQFTILGDIKAGGASS